MRRLSLILGLGVLTGCNSMHDLFTAHANVAAEAQGQVLTARRLADLMTAAKGMKMTPEAADFVANLWVDFTLFGQAIARGDKLADSATVAEAMWPEISELRGTHWHDSLMARRTKIPDAAADSVYARDSLRVLQHILIRVPPNSEPPVKVAARKRADAALAKAKGGSDFGALARQFSEDPGSKDNGGIYPPAPRGKYVTAFDSAGWSLAPGGISGVVETPFGYHIIRRPPVVEAHRQFMDYLTQQAGLTLDSLYMDSLAHSRHLKVDREAPRMMRAALADQQGSVRSTRTIATFDGGNLTVGRFLRWVGALPPQYGPQLQQSNDTMLTQFARIIGQNVLLLNQADSAGIGLTSIEWQGMQAQFAQQLDSVRMSMGIAGPDFTDPSIAPAERARVAGLKVEEFFDAMVAGRVRPHQLPSQLRHVLRDRMTFKVVPAGLRRTLELAGEEMARRDSTKPKTSPLTPAPGPAPVPGAPAPGAPAPSGKAPT
jgi:hypothetical protein